MRKLIGLASFKRVAVTQRLPKRAQENPPQKIMRHIADGRDFRPPSPSLRRVRRN
ncbi:MAG: hypothetical protein R3B47_12205 [Bacteroidia bacterium]